MCRCRTRMPGVKTHNFEAAIAEFMHEPWRHPSSFDSYAGVVSCMPTHHSIDLFWNGRALATPHPPTGIVDHADGGHLLRSIQGSKTGHQSASIVRITGRHRPDRGTISGSRADRDYRRSRHDNPPNSPRTPMAPWLVTQPAPLGPINIPNTNSRTTAGARMNSDDRASNGASTAMKPMMKRA
jgi:hypothetical protein